MTKKSLFGVILAICLFFVTGSVLANPATWAKEITVENWTAVFTAIPTFYLNASVKTSDGGMLTVGSFRGIKPITGEYKRLFALKTDSSGNHLWCKLYNLTASNYGNDFYACTELPNGNVVIVGRRTWSTEGGNGIMLEIDSSGDIQTALEFPGAFTFNCVKTTSDGGLIIAGMEGSSYSSYPIVYKLSTNFTVEWESVVQDSSARLLRNSICEVPGEGYFLATYYSGIIKLNFDGTAEWRKTFRMGTTFLYDSSVYALSSGNLMVAGSYLGYSYYGTLNQIDPDGVPVWTKCRYFNKSGQPKTFTETADGEFVVGGSSLYTGSLMWFSRLHSDGSTSWIRKYVDTDGVPFHFMKEGENSIFAVGSSSLVGGRNALNVKTDQTGAVGENSNFLFEENPAGFNLITYEGSLTVVSSYSITGLINIETAPQDSNTLLAVTAESVVMETATTCETKAVLEVQFDDTKGLNVTGELLSDSSVVINCGDGINDCFEELSDGTQVRLSATAKPGYVLDYWDDGVSTCFYENPITTTVSDDVVWIPVFRGILPTQESIREQTFDSSRIKLYSFTVNDISSIAIISGGSLDLKARVFDSSNNLVLDEDDNECANGYTDIGSASVIDGSPLGHTQTNFMYRKQDMPIDNYTLEITPQNTETPIEGEFSIVFLRKTVYAEEFLDGIDSLLSDDDTTNDYLDIYVKALYPEIYPTVNTLVTSTNYGHSDNFNNVRRERQCKALVNFFSNEFLGKGYLLIDDTIFDNWLIFADAEPDCIVDSDYIMSENDSNLIYHSQYTGPFVSDGPNCSTTNDYFYDPDTNQISRSGTENLADFVKKGDIFVQRLATYNHYGLIINENVVLDANVNGDGMLKGGLNNRYDEDEDKNEGAYNYGIRDVVIGRLQGLDHKL